MKLLFAAAAILFALPALASPKLTGTFTSLKFGTEDLTGVEITIIYGGTSHYAVVQCAEGGAGVPEVTLLQVKGSEISFQLPTSTLTECPTTPFHGQIKNAGIKGSFGNSNYPGFLSRKRSYWQ